MPEARQGGPPDDRTTPRPLSPSPDSQLPRGSAVFGHWVRVHFDGACEPRPGGGLATYGFIIEGESLDHRESGLAVRPYTPIATNNVAEYVAATRALEHLRARGYQGGVIILGDSQLVVRQMKGEYAVRSEHLRAYHEHLAALIQRFEEVRWEWVPREENREADALSQEALERERPLASGDRKLVRRIRGA